MEKDVYDRGYLSVGDGHELYYERFGNPALPPLLFIHGGPGSGFTEGHKKLFDPQMFNVLFYDQRGAGKSKPYCSLESNTTNALIEDIAKLLKHFSIEKIHIVGASWGSTLAVLFAIKHSEKVAGLALSGVFLADRATARGFVDGTAGALLPAAWDRFITLVPDDRREDVAGYYLERMRSEDEAVCDRYAYEWALYDVSLSTGETNEATLDPVVRSMSYRSLSLLTAHYIVHDFFLPEGYILEHATSLSGLPVDIVQGTEDAVTPPGSARALSQRISTSTLTELTGAHAATDIRRTLIACLSRQLSTS